MFLSFVVGNPNVLKESQDFVVFFFWYRPQYRYEDTFQQLPVVVGEVENRCSLFNDHGYLHGFKAVPVPHTTS